MQTVYAFTILQKLKKGPLDELEMAGLLIKFVFYTFGEATKVH